MIEILNGIHETVAYDEGSGIKVYHNTEPENYPLHWHAALEIIAPVRNEYTVIIDNEPHTFHEGDIWITAPGVLHELTAPPTGKRMIILFDYSLICNIKGLDSLLYSIQPYALITKSGYPELNRRLQDCLSEIINEYDNKMPFSEAYIYSLMIRFFSTLGRSNFNSFMKFPGITKHKQQEYTEKFLMVCNYITEHCTENIDIDHLAEISGFSKFHFSRLFKQFTNISCYQYLIQKRVAFAERLLSNPEIPITEVAMRSGFNSLPTFNRLFKAHKGRTPSEYRNLNRMNQKRR